MATLRSTMKRYLRPFIPLIRLLASPFYSPKYLRGRYFDDSLMGWHWVLRGIWWQKILGFNRAVPWPMSPFSVVSCPEHLDFDPNDLHIFQTNGCYYQNFKARIRIGKGAWIAPNVGFITANHDPFNPEHHLPGEDIELGPSCWIGMNAVLLPGVKLGPHTVVGAGSVVTKSFEEGYCVLAGSPAKVIRHIEPHL